MAIQINLTENLFINDTFTVNDESGNIIRFQKLNENWVCEDVENVIDTILIQKETTEEKIECNNLIGYKDNFISIETKYTELIGQNLNADNMAKCNIIIFGENDE